METTMRDRRLRSCLSATLPLLFLAAAIGLLSTTALGSSTAFYPDTSKEILMTETTQIAEKGIPVLDSTAPAHTETATFALG